MVQVVLCMNELSNISANSQSLKLVTVMEKNVSDMQEGPGAFESPGLPDEQDRIRSLDYWRQDSVEDGDALSSRGTGWG